HGTRSRRAEGSSDSRSGSSNAARGKRGAGEALEQQAKRPRVIAEALIREAALLLAAKGTDSRPCASHSNNNNSNNNPNNSNNSSTVRPRQLDFEDPRRGQQAALRAAKGTDYSPCASQSTHDSTVRQRQLDFEDPRQRHQPGQQPPNVGLIAFYFPGYREPCDERCKADFLGNFFPCCISLRPPDSRKSRWFQNAEAAFQALKFWHHEQAEEFERSSGEQAFQLKRRLSGAEDWSYGGCGTNWLAMYRVLRQKFELHSEMSRRLLETGEAFLLEHNAHPGRDKIWSDNGNGEGWNWLGLQLMLIRDELRCQQEGCSGSWTLFLRQEFDLLSGQPLASNNAVLWRQMVHKAAHELEQLLHATYSNNDNYNNNNSRNNSSSSNSTSQNSAASWEEQNLRASPVSSRQPCRKIVWRGPILLTGGALLLLFLILRTLRPDRITAMMKSVADLVCAACAPVIHPLQVLRSCMKPILEIEHDLQELMYTNDATSHFSNYNNNNDDELTATNPELEACWQNEMA
ncbi:unnamed protein product, partial [Polarella glacialis]